MMIERQSFGGTGHRSSRIIFGAAALARASQEQADEAFEVLLDFGINHIDVAASYGDAELRVGPWMERYRDDFFLATKTGERTYAGARDQIRASLERLQVERLDLLQLHNLVKGDEWDIAMGPSGALRAALEAQQEGLVRFVGVTGHGTRVAAMHLRSLERHPFDSVLLPYNFSMMADGDYAADFERLAAACEQRGVAIQTIKAVARRRWPVDARPTSTTWYEPLTDSDAIRQAVHWAMARPGVFVNSASDLVLLPQILAAAASFEAAPDGAEMERQSRQHGIEPLFIHGYQGTL